MLMFCTSSEVSTDIATLIVGLTISSQVGPGTPKLSDLEAELIDRVSGTSVVLSCLLVVTN